MNISSRSLYHYTRGFEVVKLILENGLRFNQLEEELPLTGYASNIFDQLPGVVRHVQFREGICFCDLPLHAAESHRTQYGSYAFGLSREWGMRVGASPVRYVHRKSPDIGSEFFCTILDTPKEIRRLGTIYDLMAHVLQGEVPDRELLSDAHRKVLDGVDEFCRKLLDFCDFSASYLRVHDGDWEDRVTGDISHRKFYDEREWRIVRSPGRDNHVQFTDEHIHHILVETDEERDELIAHATEICTHLQIPSPDSFARKVKTFSETYDEA